MNAVDTFPVPVRGHADPKIQALMLQAGGVAAYGRWHILLGLLYDSDGRIPLDDVSRAVLQANMQVDADGLQAFLDLCASLDLIDAGMLQRGTLTSNGVCRQLEYIAERRRTGKMGGRPKKGAKNG